MKKILAFFVAFVMLFALLPATVFAETTIDVSSITGYTISTSYDDFITFNGVAAFEAAIPEGTILTNTNYVPATGDRFCRITVHTNDDTDGLFKGVTFGQGIELYIDGKAHATTTVKITIEDCTFKGASIDRTGDSRYALTCVNKADLTIKNCVFDGVYRGMNFQSSNSSCKLTATNNTFLLTPLPEAQKKDNVAIQVSSDNNTEWLEGSINVNNNIFKNATSALRLHSSFVPDDAIGSNILIQFNDNTLINSAGVTTHPSASGDKLNAQNNVIANNVDKSGTEKGSEVTSGVDPSYIITIPAKVDFGKLVRGTNIEERGFTVSADGVVIDSGAKIDVKAISNFNMSNGTNDLPFLLYDKENAVVETGGVFASFAAGTTAQSNTGKVKVNTADILYSGDYSGIITFTVEYVAP